jgi:hypothetical protein
VPQPNATVDLPSEVLPRRLDQQPMTARMRVASAAVGVAFGVRSRAQESHLQGVPTLPSRVELSSPTIDSLRR